MGDGHAVMLLTPLSAVALFQAVALNYNNALVTKAIVCFAC